MNSGWMVANLFLGSVVACVGESSAGWCCGVGMKEGYGCGLCAEKRGGVWSAAGGGAGGGPGAAARARAACRGPATAVQLRARLRQLPGGRRVLLAHLPAALQPLRFPPRLRPLP